MVKKTLFLILFLLTAAIYGQGIRVKASTDTTDYQVGDAVNYTLRIEYDKSIGIIPPQIKDSLKNTEVLQIYAPMTTEENGRKVTIIKAIISKYDSALVTIPPIAIKYRLVNNPNDRLSNDDSSLKTILSYPVTFVVRTLKVNTHAEIKDVKAPVSIPLDWRWVAFWIICGVFLIWGGIWLYKWYKRKKAGITVLPKKIILPPHVEALNALKDLEKKQLWQKGMVKEYHSEITEIIRTYFEKRFSLPALELTSAEVNFQLKQRTEAESIINITNDFLNNADLVKFAKFKPENSVNEEMMKQALEIVNRTTGTIPAETDNV
jgi:hypothetical protein